MMTWIIVAGFIVGIALAVYGSHIENDCIESFSEWNGTKYFSYRFRIYQIVGCCFIFIPFVIAIILESLGIIGESQ
jgi:hypothetical protein